MHDKIQIEWWPFYPYHLVLYPNWSKTTTTTSTILCIGYQQQQQISWKISTIMIYCGWIKILVEKHLIQSIWYRIQVEEMWIEIFVCAQKHWLKRLGYGRKCMVERHSKYVHSWIWKAFSMETCEICASFGILLHSKAVCVSAVKNKFWSAFFFSFIFFFFLR